ncbi:peptidylprolyl isomerase [Urechidicola sp. KH5]
MRIMKLAILAMVLVLGISCKNEKYTNLDDGLYAVFENVVDSVGALSPVVVKLDYKNVPSTVANFVTLAEGTNPRVSEEYAGKPFYDGLKFHRVMSLANGDSDDFMVQGGCPFGTGMGDPGYKFKDEFPEDEEGNLIYSHDRAGLISMANAGPNGNGSQFFITLSARPHLDRRHSIFGEVVEGLEVVQNNIVANTIISHVKIIRVGSEAKVFDAVATFNAMFEEEDKLKEDIVNRLNELSTNMTESESKLKYIVLDEGTGEKPAINADITIAYQVYHMDGTLLDTNIKEVAQKWGTYNQQREVRGGYTPFPGKYSMEGQLIQGFKEAIQQLNYGGKVFTHVPYFLAYGEQGRPGIAPKSDLIFEIQIFKPEAK